jgi:PAS domain S-box-containing protein
LNDILFYGYMRKEIQGFRMNMYRVTEFVPANDQLENALVGEWLSLTQTGCCVIDESSQVVMLNATAGRLLGVDATDMLGQSARELLVNIQDSVELRALLSPFGLNGQHTGQRHDGTRTVHLQFRIHEARLQQSPRYRVLSITDVTELIVAQTLVAEHARRWQAIHAGVVLVSVTEPDLPIVYVNVAFEQMTGYSAKECIGRNCRFLQGKLRDQPGLRDIREALMAKRNGYAVIKNFRKDGSEFLNELFISPVNDATGKLTHFLGVQHVRPS